MKIQLFSLLLSGLLMVNATNAIGQKTIHSTKASTSKMVRHVVLFKFKDDATPEQVKEVETAFRKLPKQIKTIKDFEWGTNMSPENLAQGFTHCFLLTFSNAADRDAYLPHPAHAAFGKILSPYLDKVLVIDFESAR